MAIDNTITRNQYSATASQTVFAYTFEIADEDDIKVEQNGTVLSKTTHYTVSGVAVDTGGNITLVTGATSGDVITIYRDMNFDRESDYQQNGSFTAAEINTDLDRLWMAVQQTDTNLGSAIRPSITDSVLNSTNTELANVATRAGKVLGFDATGLLSYTSSAIPSGDFVDVTTTAVMAALAAPSVGDVVQTAEFSTGNGGGGTYNCVTVGTTPNVDFPNTYNVIVSTTDATKCFVLRLRNGISTKTFGVTHNGSADDTASLQWAVDTMADSGFWLISSDGTAMVDAVNGGTNGGISLPSNLYLAFLPGSEWKAITNSADSYIVCDIRNIQNVYVYNPVITGDKSTHTGATGEQGHALNLSGSTTDNIHIYNPICTKAWGDGIVIRNCINAHFYDAYCDDNRRNGITINKVLGTIHFHGTTQCLNTDGISPEAGFDIEPNDATGELNNIVIDDLYTKDNTGPGMTINIGDFPNGGADKDVTISVKSHRDSGSIYGLNIEKMAEGSTEIIKGSIIFDNQTYMNTQSSGLYVNDYASNNTPKITMSNLTILNPNENNSSSSLFGAGIAIDRKSGSGLTDNIGNIYIHKPTIIDSRAVSQMTRGISAQDNDTSGAELERFVIEDPVEISGYDTGDNAAQISIDGLVMSDKYKQLEVELSGSQSFGSRIVSKYSTGNASMFTITDSLSRNNAEIPLTLFSTNTGGIRFTPDAARAVYPLSTAAGKYVESTSVGARLVIEYNATEDHWFVREQQGTWAVEP